MKEIKHYKIIEKLGSGGMGEVYRAFDSVLEREVSIKVMHRHLLNDGTNDERFMREARAAARLVHPNVVTIHEVGMAECGRYIVMEFVQGRPLTRLLDEEGPLKPERAIGLTQQILSALVGAHSMGILHRDIKPDNILVSPEDHAKILDFGIAKITTSAGLTSAGQILGTVEYMAPEQILGDVVDQRCDIYATGVLLYQILTKRLAFTGETPVAIVYKQLNEDPVPPSYYNPEISEELDETVLKAIHKNRDERWDSAAAFSAGLDDVLQQLGPRGAAFAQDNDDLPSAPGRPTNGSEESDDPTSLRSVFIGREKEFKRLVALFSRAGRRQGQTAVIMGEAGIGKSSLATRFRTYAEQNQAWVLYGACLYLEGLDAYLPYIDALSNFFSTESHRLPDGDRRKIKDMVRERVPVLLEFTERFTTNFAAAPGAGTSDEQTTVNLFEGINVLVSLLSSMRPLVLVIDDLQWADEASLRLFHYLSRHITDDRVLLVGITRTDRFDLQLNGKPAMIVDVLSRMNREGTCEEVRLDRLSREGCDLLIDKSLVNTVLSEEFYESIWRETKGNPFFILETLKLLRETGALIFKEGAWYDTQKGLSLEVPNRVEDVFVRRLSGLSDDERETLQVAAVIGHKFDASLLAQLLESSKIKLLKSLHRVERDLQILSSTEDGFQFEHPMLRDLLYNETPAALRREYHLMIAAELEEIHGPEFGALVGDVAQHFRRGGDHRKAVPLLHQAGLRAFDLSAYREASLFFEDLIDSAERSRQPFPQSICKSDLYFKLGISYEETGRWDQSLEAYGDLFEDARQEGSPEGQVRALLRIGRIHDKAGDWETALATFQQCLDMVRDHPVQNILSRVYNNLGIIYFEKGSLDEALEYFGKAIESVDSEAGEYDRAHALTNIGIISNIRADYDTALESYYKALQVYEAKGDRKSMARAYHNIGMTHSDRGEWRQSIEAYERCLALAHKVEDRQLRALTHLNMGKAYARQENLAKAKEYTAMALKVFKRMGDTLNVAEAYHVYGIIHGARGNFTEAERFMEESLAINEEKNYREGLAESWLTYGNLCRDHGKRDRAREYYQKSAEAFEHLGLEGKRDELLRAIDNLTTDRAVDVEIVPSSSERQLQIRKHE